MHIHTQMKSGMVVHTFNPSIQEKRQKQIKLWIWGQHGHRECQTCQNRILKLCIKQNKAQNHTHTHTHTHTICWKLCHLAVPSTSWGIFQSPVSSGMWVACYFWCTFPRNCNKHPCAIGTSWDTPGTFSVRLDTIEILLSDSSMKNQCLLCYLYFKLSVSL